MLFWTFDIFRKHLACCYQFHKAPNGTTSVPGLTRQSAEKDDNGKRLAKSSLSCSKYAGRLVP
jgi:hypothetical protein